MLRWPSLLFLILACSLLGNLIAQDKVASGLARFEVVTIKPVDPRAARVQVGVQVYPGGRVLFRGLPLSSLVGAAFDLSPWQISGGDAWVRSERYNIEARTAESEQSQIKTNAYTNYGIQDEFLREMLQTLLLDRFQLKFHREEKAGDLYLLQRSDKPLALTPTETHRDIPTDRAAFGGIGYAGGKWVIRSTTMQQLAKFGSDFYLHAAVLDRTGLSGIFDYTQKQEDLDPVYGVPDAEVGFLRLIPELGLKLEKTKGSVKTVVIDSAVKPSDN